jgi:transcription initiation factor TFIIIB Brf1 subunit/transcription initiation factor TFIIB
MGLANINCPACGYDAVVETTTKGRLECTMCGAMTIFTPDRIPQYPKVEELPAPAYDGKTD